MVRQAVYFLPEAMRLFEEQEPGVQITPVFQYEGGMESFLKEESDILFALKEQARQFAWIPFDCKESFSCQLLTHKTDARESVKCFIGILKKLYSDAVVFPL